MSLITQKESISGILSDEQSLTGVMNAPKKIFVGTEGVTEHNKLTGRDEENCHPISSITGLSEFVDGVTKAIEELPEPEVITEESLEKILI